MENYDNSEILSEEELSEEVSEEEVSEEVSEEESEDLSEEESEESSDETSETIDYTETLTDINDNIIMVSNRLDFLSASCWIALSIFIAIIFYKLFAWFWKGV